jgi:uncharacterized protein YdhG (YjbR/CyaY superfamily)
VKPAKKTRSKPASASSRAAPETVEEYIELVPEASRARFMQLRAAVCSAVPAEAVEVISYRIPAFKHGKVLVWFAAFRKHCSLFPTAAVLSEFKDQLEGFTTSKGTLKFPNDKPLPVPLIKRIVKARVRQATSSA